MNEKKVYLVDGFLVTGSFEPVRVKAETPQRALFIAVGQAGRRVKSFTEVEQHNANVKVVESEIALSFYYAVEFNEGAQV